MAYLLTDIISELQDRSYPDIFDEGKYTSILNAALRDLNRYKPVTQFAAFNTTVEQTDYRICDPNDPITLGVCQNALEITDVYWNPGGDWTSFNIFSPGWQMVNQLLLFTGSYFHQPSQMMILEQKLAAWKRQFGSADFGVFGQLGDPNCILRISPVPEEGGDKVIVQFTGAMTLSGIYTPTFRWLMQWMEYRTAQACARYYASTAGVQIMGFADSTATMKYWQAEANRLYEEAIESQAGPQGHATRS